MQQKEYSSYSLLNFSLNIMNQTKLWIGRVVIGLLVTLENLKKISL